MDELLNSPLVDIATAIRERRIKSEQLVRSFLDRIEKANPPLNAVVNLTAEQALDGAGKQIRHLQMAELAVRFMVFP